MAAQVEVQPGEVGRTGVGVRLHLSPLTDSSNKSLIEGPSSNQGALIIASEPSKPMPGPKPRLTPKPFAVERNPTIRPILAPKPHTKPRPEPTRPTAYRPDPPNTPKPHQSNVTGKPRPVSTNPNRPSPTSFKPSKLNTGQTTKPVVQPFKPAPPLVFGDPSKPDPPQPAERQKPGAPKLSYSRSPKTPPAAEWSGTTKMEEEKEKTAPSKGPGAAAMTRAKSMDFLSQMGQEENKPEAAVQLRPHPRGSRPRPVSAIFLSSPTKMESASPAPRWTGRRPLSADLTSKFESIGLSLHRKPPKENSKENTPEEKTLPQRREMERGPEGTTTTPKDADGVAKSAASEQGNKKKKEMSEKEMDEEKDESSIKRRISLLLDSSSSPGAGATGQAADLRSPVQPVPESEALLGVKQRIKQLTEDPPPAQIPPVKQTLKPRPLPLDLTKRFTSERSTDLGSPSYSEATDRHETDKNPKRKVEESATSLSDQGKMVQDSKDSQEQLTEASMARGSEEGQTAGSISKESGPSSEVQTVRASLFENVVEKHSVLVVDEEDHPEDKAKVLLRSLSLKRGDNEDEGTLVTATYREPVSPSSPMRVLHSFDTVQAVEESRAVSESLPSAQLEDKAMTLRSRRSEGNKPAAERDAPAQGEPALASMPEQKLRFLRVGALQKWTATDLEPEPGMEKGIQRELERERQMDLEKGRERQREGEKEEAAAAPKRLKMLEADEQPKPRATYFALTGQMQEPVSPGYAGADRGDVALHFDDFPVRSGQWGSQGKIVQLRNPSLEAFRKNQGEESMMRSQISERQSAWDRQVAEEEMEIEKQRELKRETERQKGRMKELEREKQRQLENERQAHLEFARLKEREMQREFERQRQKEFERQKQELEEKRRVLERQKQLELEKEKQQELKRERQRQLEKERQQLERERQREQERQRELDKERQLLEIQKERQRQELERIKEMERRQLLEFEQQKQKERERQELERRQLFEFEQQKQKERERQELERRQLFEFEQQKQKERERQELERIKEMERRQLLEFEQQKQKERERQQAMELEKQRLREKIEREEAEKMKQKAIQQEVDRQKELERERERQREMEMERLKEFEKERQKELDRQRQRDLERERQKQLDFERQELENQRLRQRELEKERQRKEELERIKEIERRQLLEFEKQKQAERDRQQSLALEKQRLREKVEREEAEMMRQIAKQQEAERQRLKEKQRREEQERVALDMSPLRPKVLDLDSVLRDDPISKVTSQHSDPATRWKQPSPRADEPYKPAILDIDSFTSQTRPSPSKDMFPVAGIQGIEAGSAARSQPLTPERDGSRKVPLEASLGHQSPQWAPSHQDPWELRPGEVSVDRPTAGPQPPRKPTGKPSLEQLLQRHEERLLAPERRWSGVPDEPSHLSPFPRREANTTSSPGRVSSSSTPTEQMWFPRESEPRDHREGVSGHRRSQGSQELNRMRSRSVSRRSAPLDSAAEGSISRMRSRSAHREKDRHSWVQQSVSGEEEGKDSDTLVHESDSQYGTWETGLRTDDDSLTPATPTSDSNLSPSPRKPSPPQTPGDPSFDTDTADGLSLLSPPESQPLPFPDAPTTLLDTSALRSRAQLGKKRGPRSRPSRPARQSTAQALLPEEEGGATEDWRYRDSTEEKVDSKQDDSDSEEQAKGVDPRSAAAAQPQRIPLFPGMDPSALKAQLKKRGDSDSQFEAPAPSSSQLSRSPKSPFLPRAARVLPPSGGKENGEEQSPQWLRELKSKKRLSQYENDT